MLVGHCHRVREPFFLGPVVEALCGLERRELRRPLSPVVGALRPLLPELEEVLPPQPAAIGDPRAERHRIFRALRDLLAALGPAVCVLEDLHWADESTLELLTFLLTDPPEELSLVVTVRSEDLPSVPAYAFDAVSPGSMSADRWQETIAYTARTHGLSVFPGEQMYRPELLTPTLEPAAA